MNKKANRRESWTLTFRGEYSQGSVGMAVGGTVHNDYIRTGRACEYRRNVLPTTRVMRSSAGATAFSGGRAPRRYGEADERKTDAPQCRIRRGPRITERSSETIDLRSSVGSRGLYAIGGRVWTIVTLPTNTVVGVGSAGNGRETYATFRRFMVARSRRPVGVTRDVFSVCLRETNGG